MKSLEEQERKAKIEAGKYYKWANSKLMEQGIYEQNPDIKRHDNVPKPFSVASYAKNYSAMLSDENN